MVNTMDRMVSSFLKQFYHVVSFNPSMSGKFYATEIGNLLITEGDEQITSTGQEDIAGLYTKRLSGAEFCYLPSQNGTVDHVALSGNVDGVLIQVTGTIILGKQEKPFAQSFILAQHGGATFVLNSILRIHPIVAPPAAPEVARVPVAAPTPTPAHKGSPKPKVKKEAAKQPKTVPVKRVTPTPPPVAKVETPAPVVKSTPAATPVVEASKVPVKTVPAKTATPVATPTPTPAPVSAPAPAKTAAPTPPAPAPVEKKPEGPKSWATVAKNSPAAAATAPVASRIQGKENKPVSAAPAPVVKTAVVGKRDSSFGPKMALYINNLPSGCKWEELKEIYGKYGKVKRTEAINGVGWVQFVNPQDLEKAVGSELILRDVVLQTEIRAGPPSKSGRNAGRRRDGRRGGPRAPRSAGKA